MAKNVAYAGSALLLMVAAVGVGYGIITLLPYGRLTNRFQAWC